MEPNIRPSAEYLIGVKSIKIGSKTLMKLNTTLLSINKEGNGGTKISSATPYTLLESSIFKAVTQEFVKQLPNAKRVAAIKPFNFCFTSISLSGTPSIDLVLQKENVYWRMAGANLMVQVNKNVMCLGILERGHVDVQQKVATSIIIGSHQIEDNFLQFDLVQNKVGFSSLLLAQHTSCGSFQEYLSIDMR
ncbi:protease [Lithospermum erythrorhizon]|uniref:Protease n=1 Tax=Lithospermum erythrorhizon TaxID=34254 RepID=A0AAV3NMP8_LITER